MASRSPRPKKPRPSLLIVTDPDDTLPYARLEAELVARYARHADLTVFVGSEATVNQVITARSQATHRHFSCHAYFDVATPWHSSLTLAGGQLNAGDLAFSDEPHVLELVTLSACETGVTDIVRAPNEYGGLPAGFLPLLPR